MGNIASTKPALQTVKGPIDIPRFMGTWYVIGVKPTYFEKDATNAVEKYEWNEQKQCIDIDFTFNAGTIDGPVKKFPQTGYVFNEVTKAEWRVSPVWPLKLPYLVIELPEDYSYTVIGYPSRAYVWVMARSKVMDDDLYNNILKRLETEHLYDLNGIVKVKHSE
mmetsp:Transcript_19700/g.19800  ORF Transcript_19700/g.19800 Transcript_19700/m.19800 type:complete len:164 (-) Transcript_19700:114-605(-)